MSCPHPQNIRFVHIASQVFPDAQTVIRDERCLVCDTLLSVTYVNGTETSAVEEQDTPATIDVPMPPTQPLPVEDVTLPDDAAPTE